jgi:hypothetical protein
MRSSAADRIGELVKHDLAGDIRQVIRCMGWPIAEGGPVQGRPLTISPGLATVTTIRSYGWPARSRTTAGARPWQTAKVTLSPSRAVPTRMTPGSPVPVLMPCTSAIPSGTARAPITAVRGTVTFPCSAWIFSATDSDTVTDQSSIRRRATRLIFSLPACLVIRRPCPRPRARECTAPGYRRTDAVNGQDLRGRFNGLLCVDALENIAPEDWPGAVAGLAAALKPRTPAYVTVEVHDGPLPVPVDPRQVAGEDFEGGGLGGYHYYPARDQARDWLVTAGFRVQERAGADYYQHLLLERR